jgi:hypothetical protein
VTNISGNVQFILNEIPDSAWVVFEDGTSNAIASPIVGTNTFPLGTNTSFAIYCVKAGNGAATQISIDTNTYNTWGSPRGIGINVNPGNGSLFGRIYVDNSSAGSKGRGLFALNADQSSVFGGTAGLLGSTFTNTTSTSSPYRLSVGGDNNVYIGDFESVNAMVWQAAPDLSAISQVFVGLGDTAGIAAGVHGRSFGQPVAQGSLATSNLVVWVADASLPVGAGTTLGVNTATGNYNNLNRYNIGAGPLPWANPPDLSVNLGIAGIATLDDDMDVDPVTGNMYGMNYRLNYGMPCLQVFDPTGQKLLWSSLQGPINIGPDIFNPAFTPNGGTPLAQGSIAAFAVKISPDGKFLAIGMINNPIFIMNLTNGVPDSSTLSVIPNAPNTTGYEDIRGLCWDAGDNVYTVSSGQGLLRVFSLGLTTTCVTSNDVTGTNGSFELILPPVSATVAATTPAASQNYGTPISGVFTITLNTNFLTAPVTVNFSIGGTATNGMYIALETNSVTFPAGTSPSGNWSETVTITPTALPLYGPSTTVTLKIIGGATYLAASPVQDTVTIANTGPQYISITRVSAGSMYRGLSNDFGSFVITRLGDTNGPGGASAPSALTLTNFTYGGTAAFGTDYLAGAQLAVGSYPVDSSPGVVINPGDVTKTVIVGAPVPTPYGQPAVGTKTVVVGLGDTSETSLEGSPYTVSSGTATITELDNAYPSEIVLWSNPLTSSVDSTNWTLTFANTNLGATTVPPVVITNYPNISPQTYANDADGTQNFDVEFGYSIADDGVPPSEAMIANGWTNALKMTVNKDPAFTVGSSAGVNLYPAAEKFTGNFALRFNMDLVEGASLTGTALSEFCEFGINHYGTNCDWISGDISTYGSLYTNIDGFWTAIGSDAGGATGGTPPDYGLYSATTFPNSNVVYQPLSDPATAYSTAFKHPVPYTATGSGTPANQSGSAETSWSDVEVKQLISGGSNYTTFSVNKTVVLALTNLTMFTNGEIMLGYLDPFANNATGSGAAVYYSNVRVVEVAPFITNQPVSLSNSVGSSATFNVAATGTGPFTNLWWNGTTLVQSNVVASGPDTSSFTIASTVATNSGVYQVVISDASGGSVYSVPVTLTVVGPTSPKIAGFGLSADGTSATLQFTSADQFDTTNSFVLQNSTNLADPINAGFTNVVPAPGITLVSNVFSIDLPTNGDASFYRLEHQ